jgi:cell division protein FtsZ
MAIQLSAPRSTELKPRIVVFGIGGAGGNAVNNMIEAGLEGVEFVVANTDAQQLAFSKTERRIQLGAELTQGLGAGAHPEIGMSAAEESFPEIAEHLDGAHMVFITAGMGGGTGTGAAPIIARYARERGILTVGVVTKPFQFEGRHRMRMADAGVAELQRHVDTLIVIPNQNLFRIANERTTFAEAFGMADQVLHSGVRSITDLMVLPGLINLDFADVRTVMTEMGKAMMGTGEASGEDRAMKAAQNAIANPLLDEVSLKGAKAVLVNVTGGMDMTLLEVDEAANAISDQVDPEANIIFGAAFDSSIEGRIRVSVVATGMDGASIAAIEPKISRSAPQAEPVRFVAPEPMPAPAPAIAPEPLFTGYSVPVDADKGGQHFTQVTADLDREQDLFSQALAAKAPPVDSLELVEEEEQFAQEPAAPAPASLAPISSGLGSRGRSDQGDGGGGFDARSGGAQPALAKPGWRGLFGGRPRPEMKLEGPESAPVQAMRSSGTAQPLIVPEEYPEPQAQDDLEIPSFLRRLAN